MRREREGLFGGERGFEGAVGDSEGAMAWIVEGRLERGRKSSVDEACLWFERRGR